jgi:hypothetical protein
VQQNAFVEDDRRVDGICPDKPQDTAPREAHSRFLFYLKRSHNKHPHEKQAFCQPTNELLRARCDFFKPSVSISHAKPVGRHDFFQATRPSFQSMFRAVHRNRIRFWPRFLIPIGSLILACTFLVVVVLSNSETPDPRIPPLPQEDLADIVLRMDLASQAPTIRYPQTRPLEEQRHE